MGLIYWLSSQPSLPAPPALLTDKQAHGLAYGTLAALTLRALAQARWRGVTLRRAVVAVAIAVAYGVTDEWHQSHVVGRTAEMADLYANAVGAVSAAASLWACGIIAARRPSRQAGPSR
jgi:VanZ family protein